jgi:hypothetical protein
MTADLSLVSTDEIVEHLNTRKNTTMAEAVVGLLIGKLSKALVARQQP